jgi:hypothetical protein
LVLMVSQVPALQTTSHRDLARVVLAELSPVSLVEPRLVQVALEEVLMAAVVTQAVLLVENKAQSASYGPVTPAHSPTCRGGNYVRPH